MADRPSGGMATSRKEIGGQAFDNRVNLEEPATGGQALDSEKNGRKWCKICSGRNIMGYTVGDRFHKHFSSIEEREGEGCFDDMTEFDCSTCKVRHKLDTEKRLKICVSSSALHKFWSLRKYEGDKNHIDYLTIKGARINDLTAAWEVQYGNVAQPMDVLLVAGLENVAKGAEVSSIMRAYEHFVKLVKWQGEKYHPEVENTCAIATLMYPPTICWLEDGGAPPSGLQNHIDRVRTLNNRIEHLNYSQGIKVPNFATFGLRKVNRGRRALTLHRWSHWSKSDSGKRRMRLRGDIRVKLGRQVEKFFRFET